MFIIFVEYMGEKDANQQVASIVQQHLQSLTEFFGFCYPKEEDPRYRNMWIIDPFAANIEDSNLSYEKVMKILIQFPTTYLCEKTFSSVTVIKTQY